MAVVSKLKGTMGPSGTGSLRFERLFDDWDHDTDISMVDLGFVLSAWS